MDAETNEPNPGSDEPIADTQLIPSLDEQRSIVGDLLLESAKCAKEGDNMYVIPHQWYDAFMQIHLSKAEQIGPIDTRMICRDHQNFILVDFAECPYLSVPEPVFMKFFEWYGLHPECKPLITVLVEDDTTGELVTEYTWCVFGIHHLTMDERLFQRYSSNDAVGYFAISRLATMRDLSSKILDKFLEKEQNSTLADCKFRVWFSRRAGPHSSLLSSNYKLNCLQFIDLPIEFRITQDMFDKTLKDVGISAGDFIVETMQTGADGIKWISRDFNFNNALPSSGITGLNNLGNTCYMNSALQCLVHIPLLRDYFFYNCFEKEINRDNPLGYNGQVATAFSLLIKDVFKRTNATIARSPNHFKTTIGHLNSMFAGYLQQDSQEFLAFLLDGLHEDLNRIHDKPYVEKPSLLLDSDIIDDQVIQKLADDTWKSHCLRNDSIVQDAFVGLYKSSLKCPQCKKVSITFDPYNELTLPLPVDPLWTSKIKVFPQNSPPCILEVELPKTAAYQDLKDYVAKHCSLDASDLYGMEIFNHQFYSNFEDSRSQSQYLPVKELFAEGDNIVMYELHISGGDILVPVLNTELVQEFQNPQLFGVPFFIVISEEDVTNPVVIRQKLEKAYSLLSGGFIEFPLTKDPQALEEKRVNELKEKYPSFDFAENKFLLHYTSAVDKYFQIYVHEENVKDTDDVVWTPTIPINLRSAKRISHFFNPLIQDIYSDEYGNAEEDTEFDVGNMSTSSDDVEDSIADKKVDSTKQEAGPFTFPPLLGKGAVLICEWTTDSRSQVFTEDRQINWENPAILENKELEGVKEQRRTQPERKITLYDCLSLFSQSEVLGKNDSWYCPHCQEHQQATKQIQLWNTPDILLMHLKRFENQRSFSDKIDDVVDFPITGLDLTEHLASRANNNVYNLIAVDNHYGGLGGGHYTAYVKDTDNDKWYYFDDSRVTETEPERSVSGSAYLLFYVRRGTDNIGGAKLHELLDSSRSEYASKITELTEKQKYLYADGNDDEPSSMQMPIPLHLETADYSVKSLEVGNGDTESNNNSTRSKLRLLDKHYNTPSASTSPLTSSDSSSEDANSIIRKRSGTDSRHLAESPE